MTDERSPLIPAPAVISSFNKRFFVYIATGIFAIVTLSFLSELGETWGQWRSFRNSHTALPQVQESILASVSNVSIAGYTSEYYLSGPHLAGQNEALVHWTKSKLEDYGWDAKVENYDIYLNRPVDHHAALLNGTKVVYQLSLEEDVLEEDETTGRDDRVPTFHGYSASGNATGKLVYANLGRKHDYDRLVSQGVDLKNKIVIVRYGGLFRGLKVKFAEDLGAKAVLIYSDPAEDDDITESNGYEAYPKGPARNPSSVQRGSVQNLALHPGDPTTPGWASHHDAKRIDPEGIPGIPSIPISYKDALPLLKALNGHGPVFGEWQGALEDVDYSVGPSTLDVHVSSLQDYSIITNRNIIARLEGVTDSEVIIGNHRDAWVLGAADPNSGSAVILEVARVLGELYKNGWRPSRTIVLASWDGEEYGLLGSTEHGEDHFDEYALNGIAYINCDVAFSGSYFGVEASPLLNKIIRDATKQVSDPFDKDKSVFDTWSSQSAAHISYLGSGSDYTVFQDHIGIPSLDLGYKRGPGDNVYHYHSNYDSHYWMSHYGDTEFEAHAAIAKIVALIAVDIASNLVLPFNTEEYATTLKGFLSKYLEGSEVDYESHRVLGVADKLVKAAASFDKSLSKLRLDVEKEISWWHILKKLKLFWRVVTADFKLVAFERLFTTEHGLDDRTWFKHIVFAPGRYTGYAGQVLPGIAEALEDHDWKKLDKWLKVTEHALRSATGLLLFQQQQSKSLESAHRLI